MNTATIRAILRARLLDVPDLPPVQYEGTRFQRPATTAWLEDEFRGGAQANGANGVTRTRFLYLLTLHTPTETVVPAMDTLADALERAFGAGRTLTDTARTHQVELTSYDTGALRILADGWGYRRITIGGTAWAFRSALQPQG